MEKEAILIEAIALAEEILNYGSGGGRGVRLAAVVLQLNQAMLDGDTPLSWRPIAIPGEIAKVIFPKPAPTPFIPQIPPNYNKLEKKKESKEVSSDFPLSFPRPMAHLDMGEFADTVRPPSGDKFFSEHEVEQLSRFSEVEKKK